MKKQYKWNLKQFYSSEKDPQIEKDIREMEEKCDEFAKKYNTQVKNYLENEDALLEALIAFEEIQEDNFKPFTYFVSRKDTNSKDMVAIARIAQIEERISKAENKLIFFPLSIGKIEPQLQNRFLQSKKLEHFRVFLQRKFEDAKYYLSEQEEKIIQLKSQPADSMWTSGNARLLNSQFIIWKNKKISLPEARKMVINSKSFEERYKIHGLINEALKSVAHFSEAEINAIVTNKKIDDELRNYSKPYHSTVRSYRNEIEVVETLVSVVKKSFSLSQKYYSLKKQLLGRKVLMYPDRAVKSSEVKVKFTFDASYKKLCEIFGKIDSKYPEILTRYFENGQYDVYPKIGKRGGAYCRFGRTNPVMVFLNHTDDFHSFGTYAHEMGHAFHSEFSRAQSKLYYQYSISLAETASTLFESIAFNAVLKDLPKNQQIAALESKLDNEMATIFRQIACFNFEIDIHESVRKNGFVSKEELAKLHNKNMSDYLGKSFKLTDDDGYFFVEWPHLRYFFYVYSYVYGLLVSKALLRRYKADPSFWSKIEQFLSSGGNGSPEEILMNIGIDVKNPDFFKEGLKEVEADVLLLEKLVKESKK